MGQTLHRGTDTYSPHMIAILETRLDACHKTLAELKASLVSLSPELTPVHEKLVSILRSISAANTRSKVRNILYAVLFTTSAKTLSIQFPATEVQGFQDQLNEIRATMVDGMFLGSDNTAPSGQNIVGELLERCFRWSEIVLSR